ncbi:aminoglycoside phosphotransferase family protein [Jeotgalibacillus sp. S-D1]|uniref:phosphotransferase family protein n=1 Tax=Jeotgalibacillus sp. S-D1 TaxID=2552189 RepID=UPI0010599A82|nr:phosphotransferase [Jeotgalibacillus sp. S-D1]TDL31359.1 aminoglycoside phosphotransferase family protein [Jeotgalibacillus sp. S-D1]
MIPLQLLDVPAKIISQMGEIMNISYPKQGYTSHVTFVESTKGRYVIKHSKGKQFREWLTKETFVLKCLENVDLPVPQVYDFVLENETDQAWLLMEYIEGQTLRSFLLRETCEVKRHKAIYHFGQMMRKIHLAKCPEELKGDHTWIDSMLMQAEYNLHRYKVDGTKELLDDLERNRPDHVDQTLIHGDLTVDNVLVKDGKINAIIDWSGGAFGDPRYDAALAIRPKPNAFQAREEVDIFFKGYGKQAVNRKEFLYFEEGLYEFF